MKEYDVVVIGAGSGGLVAALTAHRHGAKVALLEKHLIGGECTHTGCVPSKALIKSAKLYTDMKEAAAYGLPAVDVSTQFDFGSVMGRVESVVNGIYEHEKPEVFNDMGIDTTVHPSGAQFIDNHQIRVGDETIRAEHVVIATGSKPRMVEEEGDNPVPILHNENFWELRKQPKALMFLGGGVISAELGQAMARFGTEVTIIDRNPHILKVVDEDVRQLAIEILQQDGVKIITDTTVQSCQMEPDGRVQVHAMREGDPIMMATDAIFAAIGRIPTTGGMNLEAAGVDYTQRGITTNDYLQTTADNIYACGDVATPQKFTHVAAYQAEVVIKNILNGNKTVNDLTVLPWAIFTEPEIAHVGMNEAEARAKLGKDVQVFRVNATIDRNITEGETTGFLKVVLDGEDRLVGADAIGAHAGEWIHILTVALQNKLPITAIADTIFAYPTFSEIVKKAFTRFLRTKIKKQPA